MWSGEGIGDPAKKVEVVEVRRRYFMSGILDSLRV